MVVEPCPALGCGNSGKLRRSSPPQSKIVIFYADASFLFSFFADDSNSGQADRWMRGGPELPLIVTRLGIFECENAMRTAVVDHRLALEEQREASKRIKRALSEGFLVRREVSASQWFPQAHRLSAFNSEARAFGALDILHVAAALILHADGFLSFDANQRLLAEGEGLLAVP